MSQEWTLRFAATILFGAPSFRLVQNPVNRTPFLFFGEEAYRHAMLSQKSRIVHKN